MKKLVTLLSLSHDGLQTETFEDDFIMDIPDAIVQCFNPNKVIQYCEEMFREVAYDTIIGPSCEKIMADACHTYNWGDCMLHVTKDILHTVSLCRVDEYDGSLTKDMICPRYTVEVNQDEVLLPETLDGTLIIRITDEYTIRVEGASVDFATGAVVVELQDEKIVSENLFDLFIDFGNGIDHKVATNEEQRDDTDGVYFYFDKLN